MEVEMNHSLVNEICELKDFVGQSKTFGSITFQGCYSMSIDVFLTLFEYYAKTGENLLDAYSEHIYLNWDADSDDYCYTPGTLQMEDEITPDEFAKIQSNLSKLRRLKICDPDDLRIARVEARCKLNRYYKHRDNEIGARRRRACGYTSSMAVKEYIIKKYGWRCVKCDTDKDISIDHIIPVYRGGRDELKNLQPLCKRCNSLKGIKSNIEFIQLLNG